MLVTEFVDVTIGGKNIKYYKGLGYDVKLYQTIAIPIEHLQKTSHAIVEVLCDYCCEIHVFKEYRAYLSQRKNGKDCCKKCSKEKVREGCLDKYGVENVMYVEEFKDNLKQTMIERYGVEYISQSDEYKIKIKECWENKTEEELQARRNKIEETNLKKYGVPYYSQSQEYNDKRKETSLEKYECEDFAQNKEVRQKYKDTCMNKYGVDNYSKTEEFKEKAKETWLKIYGVEHPSKVPEIKEKAIQSLLKYGNIYTSTQQVEVYEMIKTLFDEDNVFLNYPFDYYVLDVVIFLDNLKINVEYDGWFWHKKRSDNPRNSYLLNRDWKILRIKSGHKLPTIEELKNKLKILIETDEKYQEIILDDWKEKEVAV